MLSFHGLVIIASDIENIYPGEKTSFIKLEIASESAPGKTERHKLSVFCPNSSLAEVKSKLVIGTVIEITHGNLNSYESKSKLDDSKTYSNTNLNVSYYNIRFLKKAFYFESIPGITEELPNKQGDV